MPRTRWWPKAEPEGAAGLKSQFRPRGAPGPLSPASGRANSVLHAVARTSVVLQRRAARGASLAHPQKTTYPPSGGSEIEGLYLQPPNATV